jgi:hypothetical protein
MEQTITQPLLGLGNEFPDQVFLVHHKPSGKYGCYVYQGVHGLACFSSEDSAFRFAEWLDLNGIASMEVSFDEAREVAKDRPLPVVSLMLLDNLNDPVIHFVR